MEGIIKTFHVATNSQVVDIFTKGPFGWRSEKVEGWKIVGG